MSKQEKIARSKYRKIIERAKAFVDDYEAVCRAHRAYVTPGGHEGEVSRTELLIRDSEEPEGFWSPFNMFGDSGDLMVEHFNQLRKEIAEVERKWKKM